jgi:hypothetical protein
VKRLQVLAHAVLFLCCLPFAAVLVSTDGRTVVGVAAVMAVASLLTAALSCGYSLARDGTASSLLAFIAPGNVDRREAVGLSLVEALELRGELELAVTHVERLVAASPSDAAMAFAAVELYLRAGRLQMAVQLLRRVRLDDQIARGEQLRASNRLVDIHCYMTPDPILARRELTLILRRHAGSAAATGAARLLSELDGPDLPHTVSRRSL